MAALEIAGLKVRAANGTGYHRPGETRRGKFCLGALMSLSSIANERRPRINTVFAAATLDCHRRQQRVAGRI
jgi:hypothetical protein